MKKKNLKNKEKKIGISAPIFYILILLSIIFIIVCFSSGAVPVVDEPEVTKSVFPTEINVKGTGFDEIATITLEITGGGSTSTEPIPMDVVFGIDSSGSMAWNDPSDLRLTASKNFVDMMDSSIDTGGVVSWDDNIDFTYGLSSDFVTLKNQIDLVNTEGETNLNVGLNGAIQMLDSNPRIYPSSEVIIFLTDGQGTYTYSGNPGSPADDAANKGYTIYSIGLGASHDSGPLIDMADATGGNYYNSPSASNLIAIYNQIYDEILTSTIPYNVDVTEVTQSYIVDEESFNIPPDSITTNMAGETVIIWNNIGLICDGDPDFSSDETVIFTFDIKSDLCGDKLNVDVYCDSKIEYEDNDGNYIGYILIPQAKIDINCDSIPPVTTKDHGPCILNDPAGGFWYMQTNNPIYLYARDDLTFGTGVDFLHYEIWYDSNSDGTYNQKKLDKTVYDTDPDDLNSIYGEIDIETSINQECCHKLVWYSVDNFGNQEQVQEQFYRMDGTPPIQITKTHPDPCYEELNSNQGIIRVNSDIILDAVDGGTDPCVSGVKDIYYGFTYNGKWYPEDTCDIYCGNSEITMFKNGKWWYTYNNPINFHESCEHVLEYFAVDNVCNIGPIESHTYWVNDCHEEVWIDDNFGFSTPGFFHTHFNEKQIALDWLQPGGTAYVYDGDYYNDILIDDVPCCDNTGLTQKGEYGCFPIDESAVIYGSEIIKVDNVKIKYMEYTPNLDGSIIVEEGVSGTYLRCNKFVKNCIENAVGVKSYSSSPVNAKLNWWGRPDGPDGGIMNDGKTAEGLGVKVIGNVNVEPWLGIYAEISKPVSNIVVDVGTPVIFDATGSFAYTYSDCCQNEEPIDIDYLWDFDDGKYAQVKTIGHIFSTPGTYVVSLRVDSIGIPGLHPDIMFDWDYITVEVVTPTGPLTANADGQNLGGYQTTINQELTFYGSASGGNAPYNFEWDLGDGNEKSEQNPTHIYNTPGSYFATLTVIDSNYEIDQCSVEIIVHDVDDLFIRILAPYENNLGSEIIFNSDVTGGTEPYKYEWNFGDGSTSNKENPNHIYENPGEYTVTLKVTDNNEETDTVSKTVNIVEFKEPEIKLVKGGLGILALIKAGSSECSWEIDVDGRVIFGGKASDVVSAYDEVTADLGFSFAIGKVDIFVKVGKIVEKYSALALGPFYFNLKKA